GRSRLSVTGACDREIACELESTVARLFDRHLDQVDEWFPHEMVPWSRGRDFDGGPTVCGENITQPARSALLVNLLTEDNLPYYFRTLSDVDAGTAWSAWVRRWTAEEGRHSIVIRDYLTVTRSIDPVELERARMHQVSMGIAPRFGSLADALV